MFRDLRTSQRADSNTLLCSPMKAIEKMSTRAKARKVKQVGKTLSRSISVQKGLGRLSIDGDNVHRNAKPVGSPSRRTGLSAEDKPPINLGKPYDDGIAANDL